MVLTQGVVSRTTVNPAMLCCDSDMSRRWFSHLSAKMHKFQCFADNVIGGIITKPSNAFRRSYNDDPVIFNCTTASKYLPWWKFSDETSHSDTVTNSACGIIISSRYGSWFMTESVGPGSCNLIMVPSGDYPLVGSLVCTDSTLSSATAIVVQTSKWLFALLCK